MATQVGGGYMSYTGSSSQLLESTAHSVQCSRCTGGRNFINIGLPVSKGKCAVLEEQPFLHENVMTHTWELGCLDNKTAKIEIKLL